MPSLHRHVHNGPNWFCAFYGPDGKREFKSTKTPNRKLALKICLAWDKAAIRARGQSLSVDRAREIIEGGVLEIMEETGQVLPHSTIREFFMSWLKEKQEAGAETTYLRYEGIVARFLKYLGARADQSLSILTVGDIRAFRDWLAGCVTAGTVNVYLKVVRVALGRAVREQYITRNPATLVESLRNREKHERRAFTLTEVKRMLGVASTDWQTMILLGLYTGLRLQDAANLSWVNIDLQTKEISLRTGKTGRFQVLPLAKPLLKHLEALPAGDDPKAPLCPSLEGKSSGPLSNQFYGVMAAAGLVTEDRSDHRKKNTGRDRRRNLSDISFHALRHTATSWLKNAGIADAVAMDIIGHESEAVSRNYTHIDSETKRKAVDRMPDVFK